MLQSLPSAALLRLVVIGRPFASTDTYRQLNLFGDVFERVKNDYVREVKDGELVESAINGMLNGARSALELSEPQEFLGHAGFDPRRVRRARA